MDLPAPPSYDGHGLVNLVAELEARLTGSSPTPTLDTQRSVLVPSADSYVFVLFDGLGAHQLDHPSARDLRSAAAATLEAPFPTMTTVSLATIATGHPPSHHGLIAYKLWMEEHDEIVNTIHMTTVWGDDVPGLDLDGFLPPDNLWERLVKAGIEPIVIQPGNFQQTKLTTVLYRGARFEGYWSADEAVRATLDLASVPGRFMFLYIPYVDFAAHISGQRSPEYGQAMQEANRIWASLAMRLPPTVGLVGTADHGHVDIPVERRYRIDSQDVGDGFVSEDGRMLFVFGGDGRDLADRFNGVWHEIGPNPSWWGPPPFHPQVGRRLPEGIVFLPDDIAVLTKHGNDKLIGFHGSLEPAERDIPLLIRG